MADAINKNAKGRSHIGTWIKICGWSLIATLWTPILIGCYSFAPGLSIAGIILAVIGLATFTVSLGVVLLIGLRGI